jgi:hypothetical protein
MTIPKRPQDMNIPASSDKDLRQMETKIGDIEQICTQIQPDLTKRSTIEDALALDMMGF